MSNELQVLETKVILNTQVSVYGTKDNPLFLAKEVADWIEHSNPRMMLQKIDEDEKVVSNVYTLGGSQESWFLTEDGLYEVLMQSRKPIAKQFKKEVKQILKDIRKHGGYLTPEMVENVLLNPDTIIQLATNLKQERKLRLVAEQQIKELKSRADYTDMILQNKGLVTVNQIAKDYGMSAQTMNKKLHELGVQYKQSKQWLLYAKHQCHGYTHSETVDIVRSDGQKDVKMNTKWTQKGRLFIYELLKSEGVLPVIEREEAS